MVGNWPRFFTGRRLGWMIAARVDGTGYILQGAHTNYTPSKVLATFITPTRTIFTMDAGPMRLNLTYLTPIELDDWTRHSLPFGYFSLDLWSTDGKGHSVQLYSDISGEFVTPFLTNILNWNTTVTPTLIYHQAYVANGMGTLDTKETDLSSDGTQAFAFRTTPGVAATWQSCSSEMCRNNFVAVGNLGNITDANFRAVNNSLPVTAFALDLGNIIQSDSSLVFAIGLFRNTTFWYYNLTSPATAGDRWMTQISPWRRRWSNISDAIDSSLLDFRHTLYRNAALDTKIVSDTLAMASKFGLPTSATANLTDLVIMSVRQTIGSLEITTSVTDQGPVKLDDLKVFMKDMGNSGRVNPLEVIYASFPAFLYLNSSLAGKLLEPLLETNVTSDTYNPEYAKSDLGPFWPRAQPNMGFDYPLGIESSGSMVILALAYTQKSGDKSLISKYYKLILKWADFLVKHSLDLNGFMTEAGSYSEMSNLSLKGIAGIYAMGKINQLLEGSVSGADTNRTSYYLDQAQNYARQWQNLTLSSTQDHIVSVLGNDKTWGLLYNLYAMRLIGADLIPNKVYGLQASWNKDRKNPASTMASYEYIDPCSKMHWALLGAGSIFQDTTGTRDAIITSVHNFSFADRTNHANPSTICINVGPAYHGNASAAVGAAFVFHALSLPDLATPTTSATPSQSPNSNSSRSAGYKLGIILGSLVVLIFLVGMSLYWRRLSRQRRMGTHLPPGETHTAPYLCELGAPATHQPSKHRVFETAAHHSNVFLASNDHDAKPSTLRRRAEVIHASNEPNGSHGNPETRVTDTGEESLRRQVEQLRIELGEALRAQEDGIPPPYTDDIS